MNNLFELAKKNTEISYNRHPQVNTIEIHIKELMNLILHNIENIVMDASMIGKNEAYIGIYHKKYITDSKLRFYNFIYMPDELANICDENDITPLMDRLKKEVDPFDLSISQIDDYVLFKLSWDS